MKQPYETIFLLPPNMNENQMDEFIGKSKDLVQHKQGDISEVQRMGVRKTAYKVNKSSSAYYVLLKYSGTGETVHELERLFKNSDEVWKYLTTKASNKPTIAPKSKSKIRREEKKAAAKIAAAAKLAAPANNDSSESKE